MEMDMESSGWPQMRTLAVKNRYFWEELYGTLFGKW